MKSTLDKAFGYQGDSMNLPVPDLDAALPFYVEKLGFRIESRAETPIRSAVLARDAVRMGLAENGGDPMQDGCAFHVTGVEALLAEYAAVRPPEKRGVLEDEHRDGAAWKVFFVVAPDGLCFWFGERQAA